MPRYVDAARMEKAIASIDPCRYGGKLSYAAHLAVHECLEDIRRLLREIPSADVAPVAHGRWIPNSPFTGNCSRCGGDGNLKDKYCSDCGAQMTGRSHTVTELDRAVPVVHGRWVLDEIDGDEAKWHCSVCKRHLYIRTIMETNVIASYPRCRCGALMDREDRNSEKPHHS